VPHTENRFKEKGFSSLSLAILRGATVRHEGRIEICVAHELVKPGSFAAPFMAPRIHHQEKEYQES
jgi:hypothetical protein